MDPDPCLARMMRYFYLLFILAFVNKGFCLQSSCGAEQEITSPGGGGSCGCDKLKRAAAVDPKQDRAASDDPALKYSESASERTSEAHGEEKKIQSQVCCGSC